MGKIGVELKKGSGFMFMKLEDFGFWKEGLGLVERRMDGIDLGEGVLKKVLWFGGNVSGFEGGMGNGR